MENTSLKNVSPAAIEAAVAKALQELTGWEKCTVNLEGLEFKPSALSGHELVRMGLDVRFSCELKSTPF